MKCKVIIQTRDREDGGRRTSELWSGEIEFDDQTEYMVKMSILAEGQPQPIVDIPFALGVGYYMWIPPDGSMDETDDGYSLT